MCYAIAEARMLVFCDSFWRMQLPFRAPACLSALCYLGKKRPSDIRISNDAKKFPTPGHSCLPTTVHIRCVVVVTTTKNLVTCDCMYEAARSLEHAHGHLTCIFQVQFFYQFHFVCKPRSMATVKFRVHPFDNRNKLLSSNFRLQCK